MSNFDNYDKAIIIVFDQSPNNAIGREKAHNFLESVKRKSTFWKLLMSKLVNPKTHETVSFWCLIQLNEFLKPPNQQTSQERIVKYQNLSNSDKAQLQKGLLHWIKICLVKNNFQNHLKNKYCSVLIRLYRIEYLKDWGSFWTDLFTIIQGLINDNQVFDIFLRILHTIDEEIVSRDYVRSNVNIIINRNIKNKMRNDCIKPITQLWYKILKGNNSNLIVFCLTIMSNYIEWIDISIITTSNFINLFFSFLNNNTYKYATIYCFNSIILKGMPPSNKLRLIKAMKIIPLINSMKIPPSDEKLLISVSKISNSIGIQLMFCWLNATGNESNEAYQMMLNMMTIILNLFNNGTFFHVSSNVTEFVTEYVKKLKRKRKIGGGLNSNEKKQLLFILQTIQSRVRYKGGFNFNVSEQTDDEGKFENYRTSLFHIFKHITPVDSSVVLNFVKQILTQVFSNIKNANFPNLEVALSLFYITVMSYDEADKNVTSFFKQVICAIVNNHIVKYQHDVIQGLYFDIVSKFSRLILSEKNVLGTILKSFVTYGFHSKSEKIKTKSYGCFLPFVKSCRAHLAQFADKLVEVIIPSMKLSLEKYVEPENPDQPIAEDYKMNLYEAMGVLVGQKGIKSDVKINLLSKLITPTMNNMNDILKQRLYMRDREDNPQFSILLSKQILSLSYLSKGLPSDGKDNSVLNLFNKIIQIVLSVIQAIPNNKYIKCSVTMFLKTMITLFPHKSSVNLFSPIVNQLFTTAKCHFELHDVISLVIQIMNFEKRNAFAFVNSMFLKITKRMKELIGHGKYLTLDQQHVDQYRHELQLQKIYYLMLKRMNTVNLFNVFTSKENSSSLPNILNIIVMGMKCSYFRLIDASFGVMLIFLSNLLPKKNQSFAGYTFKDVLPLCFSCPMKMHFDLEDAQYQMVLSNIVKILKGVSKCYPNQFKSFLSNYLVQFLRLNENDTNMVIKNIFQSKNDKVQEMLSSLFQSRKCKI